MPPLTDIVRKLLEKGVALETALIAAEVAEQAMKEEREAIIRSLNPQKSADAQAERRREKDRIRARLRLRKSAENPQNSAECGTAALVPQVKNLSSFSTLESKKERKEDSLEALTTSRPQTSADKTKRGCRLPEDWSPEDPDFADEMLGRVQATVELAKFRDYWKAQPGARGVKADWQATWRNWVRKASEQRQAGGNRNDRSGSLMAALDRLEDRLDREAETGFELPESNLFRLPLGSVRGS